MKTIMILTASTGGGHNKAAMALAETFESNGYTAYIIDIFCTASERLDTIMVDGYSFFAKKLPRTYGHLYKISNQKIINKQICNSVVRRTWKSLFYEIGKINPDLLISTHPFAVETVTKIKRQYYLDCPYIAIITDFIAHQTYINSKVDGYIVGSNETKQDLANKKIPLDKIFVCGIPTDKEFYKPISPPTSQNHLKILAMAGSIGISSMETYLETLLKSTNCKVTAVCGNNKSLYNKLKAKFDMEIKKNKLILFGFTNDVCELMDNNDLIMTKPGGLTTTESILRQIPMIIPYKIPGQESENAEILVKEGIAIETKTSNDLIKTIATLTEHPDLIASMRKKMKNISKTYSNESIVLLSEKMIKEKNKKKREHLSITG